MMTFDFITVPSDPGELEALSNCLYDLRRNNSSHINYNLYMILDELEYRFRLRALDLREKNYENELD